MNASDPRSRLILALDVPTLDEVKRAMDELGDYVDTVKVGLQLLTAAGTPEVVKEVKRAGKRLMYDGKFHDIPETLTLAVRELNKYQVDLFTFHACNSRKALKAVADEHGEMTSLGVTVLTTIDREECIEIFGAEPGPKVMEFAKKAKKAKCRGVVCSPKELKNLWLEEELQHMQFVTPGSRPIWAPNNDQERVLTPGEAIQNGASALVIGRPIMQPPKEIGGPVEAVKRILDEINDAMAKMPPDGYVIGASIFSFALCRLGNHLQNWSVSDVMNAAPDLNQCLVVFLCGKI
ncbi:MAG: orotidine-5'-phosphate decarboxylase [Candidatus Altimarinota bacterium]